ncbi:UPF0398 protein [Enterococcus saigonensis]|uniref:UPF0398 protein EsVE80_12970 n=1 Tax=Enterococcus saigonensis TaxID=1805431 RepID=A0A679IPJ3_9ENTE|nr:DUF1273 domain-containing protein [Enterococcus saigonensis]BCA85774.1 UPF0398 protein [Enterococcus saigonensis]
METIKTLLLTGYRSYELGVFQDKDPKISIIKKAIKNNLVPYLDAGLEWVIVSGNLGVEMWGAELMSELKVIYPNLHLGVIFPFEEFGKQWNEGNQEKLVFLRQEADYVEAVSHKPYHSPQQLQNHTKFLLQHTDGVLAVFDPEFPGKPKYLLDDAQKIAENTEYLIQLITMDDLQNTFYE